MTTQTARIVVALVVIIASLLSAPLAGAQGSGQRSSSSSPSSSYGWPVKPFHRQHPVRGFFGDPAHRGGWPWNHALVPLRHRHLVPRRDAGLRDPERPGRARPRSSRDRRDRRRGWRPDLLLLARRSERPRRPGRRRVTAPSSAMSPRAGRTCTSRSRGTGSTSTRCALGALEPYVDTTRPSVKSLRVERGSRTSRRHSVLGHVRSRRRGVRHDADAHRGTVARQARHPRRAAVAAEGIAGLADGCRRAVDDPGGEPLQPTVRDLDPPEQPLGMPRALPLLPRP